MTEQIIKNNTTLNYTGMIGEKWRNQFYYDALNKHAEGKVVLDMGSGTGILSFYALEAGAKFVYAIEGNKQSADLTYQVLKSKFDTSKFAVINCDFYDSETVSKYINHPIDILVSETVGPGLFDQGMIHTWLHVKPYLAPNAISIPDTLSCDIWVWRNQLDSEYLAKLEPLKFAKNNLASNKVSYDACISQDFVKALIGTESNAKNIDPQRMRWTNINHIKIDPDDIYTDKIIYRMDSLPDFGFFPEDPPWHIKPSITIDIDVDGPSTVAIINKMSFESQTMYIKDALFVPWKYNPVFNLNSAGTYHLVYNNFGSGQLYEEEWKIQS